MSKKSRTFAEKFKIRMENITFDKRNYRKHSDENKRVIKKSLEELGAGRSVVIDKDGALIAGNGVYEQAQKLKMPVRVVETDGRELVVVKRTDLATGDEKRKRLALADNVASDLSDFDNDLLQEDFTIGELGDWGLEIDEEVNEADVEQQEVERKRREFAKRMANGENLEEDEEYQAFKEKFEQKKTTDDCYTPELVYEAVADWVANEYGLNRKDFVRPFYPGGDYKNEKYPAGCVVVDNPPFSILAEITRFYKQAGVRFFLFAPRISNLSVANSQGFTNLCVGAGITYENGAIVPTSFITNLEGEYIARSCPSLYKAVTEANEKVQSALHREIPKYAYPDHVVTAAMLSKYSKYDVIYGVKFSQYQFIGELDAQKEAGKAIYAGGLLVCDSAAAEKAAAEKAAAEKAAAEKAAAEKAAAENAAATQWKLSDRELAIVAELNKKEQK